MSAVGRGAPDVSSIVESSVVIGAMRRLARDSYVWAMARRVVADPLRHGWTRLRAARRARHVRYDDAPELARLESAVGGSRLFRAAQRGLDLPIESWQTARVARAADAVAGGVRALEMWQRVRLIGWMLVVAVLMGGLVGGFADPPLRELAIGVWLALLALGGTLMWQCRAIAAAWADRWNRGE